MIKELTSCQAGFLDLAFPNVTKEKYFVIKENYGKQILFRFEPVSNSN
jgi:hypothetical protein